MDKHEKIIIYNCETFFLNSLGKWFGCFWFLNHSLRWFLVVPSKDGFAFHVCVLEMTQVQQVPNLGSVSSRILLMVHMCLCWGWNNQILLAWFPSIITWACLSLCNQHCRFWFKGSEIREMKFRLVGFLGGINLS